MAAFAKPHSERKGSCIMLARRNIITPLYHSEEILVTVGIEILVLTRKLFKAYLPDRNFHCFEGLFRISRDGLDVAFHDIAFDHRVVRITMPLILWQAKHGR